MSSSYDPNRQRIDARPRNVYHTPEGRRVVGPTSAEISAQTSKRQYRGGPLYESRPLTQGGGLDGYYAMQKGGRPRPQSQVRERPHHLYGSQAGRLAPPTPEPKGEVPATIKAGTIQADPAAAFKKELPPMEILGGSGSAVPNPVPVPKSLDPKGDAAGMGTIQAEPDAAFKKELPPLDLGLPPLMRNSYSHLAQPPARTKKTLLA
ncbi:MAG: hypothetical protein V4672_16355 [Verrucomicrobiota bacterium]